MGAAVTVESTQGQRRCFGWKPAGPPADGHLHFLWRLSWVSVVFPGAENCWQAHLQKLFGSFLTPAPGKSANRSWASLLPWGKHPLILAMSRLLCAPLSHQGYMCTRGVM